MMGMNNYLLCVSLFILGWYMYKHRDRFGLNFKSNKCFIYFIPIIILCIFFTQKGFRKLLSQKDAITYLICFLVGWFSSRFFGNNQLIEGLDDEDIAGDIFGGLGGVTIDEVYGARWQRAYINKIFKRGNEHLRPRIDGREMTDSEVQYFLKTLADCTWRGIHPEDSRCSGISDTMSGLGFANNFIKPYKDMENKWCRDRGLPNNCGFESKCPELQAYGQGNVHLCEMGETKACSQHFNWPTGEVGNEDHGFLGTQAFNLNEKSIEELVEQARLVGVSESDLTRDNAMSDKNKLIELIRGSINNAREYLEGIERPIQLGGTSSSGLQGPFIDGWKPGEGSVTTNIKEGGSGPLMNARCVGIPWYSPKQGDPNSTNNRRELAGTPTCSAEGARLTHPPGLNTRTQTGSGLDCQRLKEKLEDDMYNLNREREDRLHYLRWILPQEQRAAEREAAERAEQEAREAAERAEQEAREAAERAEQEELARVEQQRANNLRRARSLLSDGRSTINRIGGGDARRRRTARPKWQIAIDRFTEGLAIPRDGNENDRVWQDLSSELSRAQTGLGRATWNPNPVRQATTPPANLGGLFSFFR